jgi:hypothetical protein
VTNKSDRMHAFWLDQLEEAAEGLATEGAEWSASLMQRARGYARLGPVPSVGAEYDRLERLRGKLRRQQNGKTGPAAEALAGALGILSSGESA